MHNTSNAITLCINTSFQFNLKLSQHITQYSTLSLQIQIFKLVTTIFNFCKPNINENCILNVFLHVFLRFEGLKFE